MNVDDRKVISSLKAQEERLLRDQRERVVPCSNGRIATIPDSPKGSPGAPPSWRVLLWQSDHTLSSRRTNARRAKRSPGRGRWA